jgi:archaellum component FlaC
MVAIKSKASFQPSGEAAAKVAKRTGTPTDLERVAEAIRDGAVPCPSEGVRMMLLQGLPHALLTTNEVAISADKGNAAEAGVAVIRHEFQDEMLSLVRRVLEPALAAAEEARTAVVAEKKEVDEVLDALNGESTVATERAEAEAMIAKEKLTAYQAAVQAVEEADQVHAEAKAATGPVQEAKQKAEATKDAVTAMVEEMEAVTQVGADLSAAALEKSALNIAEFLEEIRAEKCLVAAAPSALGKAAKERGRFDQITLQSVSAVITNTMREVDAKVTAATPAVEEASAMQLGTWAIHDLAKEHEAETSKVLATADEAAKLAATKARAAGEQVESQGAVVHTVLIKQEREDEKVDCLRAALDSFDRLVAGVAAEAEEAAMDDEASIPAASPALSHIHHSPAPPSSPRKTASVVASPSMASPASAGKRAAYALMAGLTTTPRSVATPTRGL